MRRHDDGDGDTGYPQYEWALEASGQPVHISQAARGDTYTCPLCYGRMVAKLGAIKQHHFAHDQIKTCTPANVARAAAGRWILINLRHCLQARQSLMMTWPCPVCHQQHTADLLRSIGTVEEAYYHDEIESDIALLDRDQRVRATVLLTRPTPDMLLTYSQHAIMAIVIDVTAHHDDLQDLAGLLAGSRIYGGVCDTQKTAAETGTVTDPHELRRLLADAVSRPPYNIYGSLDNLGGLTHVFRLGDRRLWLPPILWQRAIGGLHHKISPALQIVSQEWPQEDGATIALYYVTAGQTLAIAVRRFPPGQDVYARLDASAFHTPNLTAARVARSFAEL